jgi:hypothetical protein
MGTALLVLQILGNNMLAFRYGEERGKRFVAFSDISNDKIIDYGCPVGEFYIEHFSPTGTTSCHKRELDALTDGFLKGSIKKVWETPDAVYNYLSNEHDLRSFVFICRKDGKTFQVDSDFLTEDDYRKMFDEFSDNQQEN